MINEVIVDSMISYVERDEEYVYTANGVEECRQLLNRYLNKLVLMEILTDEEIMNQVKHLVLY